MYSCTISQWLHFCLCFLSLGILCLLCMCGVYIRHNLPALHSCPMAVFCSQHLRMGPVCLAHRLGFNLSADSFYLCQPKVHLPLNNSLHKEFIAAKLLQTQEGSFLYSTFVSFIQREESAYPLFHCGSCLCTSKQLSDSKI